MEDPKEEDRTSYPMKKPVTNPLANPFSKPPVTFQEPTKEPSKEPEPVIVKVNPLAFPTKPSKVKNSSDSSSSSSKEEEKKVPERKSQLIEVYSM